MSGLIGKPCRIRDNGRSAEISDPERILQIGTDGAGNGIGAFTYQPGAPDRGKFTLTLRRDPGGRWLIMSDMDNGNSRP